ncbi:MAG: hypothetical protein K2V38_04985, partial [Gemmataceae bacterium]|nr:hypothetical protein [Gemmataceae bacterium]
TPDYMAPEQAKNSRSVDARADLYSLGCTLYYLLTGQPPFPSGGAIEKLVKHQTDQPAPLQALRPAVPTEVAEIVARLMAKRPDDRFPTAGAFADAVAPFARYPSGSAAVPVIPVVRDDRRPPASAETLSPRSTSPGSAFGPAGHAPPPLLSLTAGPPSPLPVAPSDPTPRPRTLGVAGDAIDAKTEPGGAGGENGPPAPRRRKRKKRPPAATLPAPRRAGGVWVAAGALALGLVASVVLILVLGRKPPTADPTPSGPPAPPDGAPAHRVVPAVNPDALASLAGLIPDGTGTVVVAYPAAYFRDKETPFGKGAGPTKLGQFAARFQYETELNLTQSDRAVLSLKAVNPAHYAVAAEGPYLGPKLAADLDKHPRLSARNPPAKQTWPFKVYSATPTGDRFTAYLAPPAGSARPSPVCFVLKTQDMVNRTALRLAPTARPAPDLDPVALAALNPHTTPGAPPLLTAVVTERQKLPFAAAPTLKDVGARLVVVNARMADRLDLDVTVYAASHDAARKAVEALLALVRAEYPLLSRLAGPVVQQALADAPRADGDALALRIRATPEQWSALLELILP